MFTKLICLFEYLRCILHDIFLVIFLDFRLKLLLILQELLITILIIKILAILQIIDKAFRCALLMLRCVINRVVILMPKLILSVRWLLLLAEGRIALAEIVVAARLRRVLLDAHHFLLL